MKEKIKHLLNRRSNITQALPGLTPAAVLIPIFCQNGSSTVLLTKRTHLVRHHKGQISFPGGVQDSEETLEWAARRESFEEIGLEQDCIEILGQLKPTITITGYLVTPFVGLIPHPYPFKINPAEVEKIIMIPFSFLMNSANLRIEPFEHEGRIFETEKYDYEGNIVWGATARIIRILGELLASEISEIEGCIK